MNGRNYAALVVALACGFAASHSVAAQDLVIDSITFTTDLSDTPGPGSAINVWVRVRNAGDVAINGQISVKLISHSETEPECSALGGAFVVSNSLAPGATAVGVGGASYWTAGVFQLWALVDCSNFIQETDETNNAGSLEITVRDPDFAILYVQAPSPGTLERFETFSVRVGLVNNGGDCLLESGHLGVYSDSAAEPDACPAPLSQGIFSFPGGGGFDEYVFSADGSPTNALIADSGGISASAPLPRRLDCTYTLPASHPKSA